jgi:uracil-DNA glycosylase
VSEPHGSGNGEDVPLCVSFVRSALLFDSGNAKPYIFVAREPHWSNPPGVRQMADHAIKHCTVVLNSMLDLLNNNFLDVLLV